MSAGVAYKITVNPGHASDMRCPAILLLHGNFSLGPPYGAQIQKFARDLAELGYVTAVPQYYEDDEPHLTDTTPHVQTLSDAIEFVGRRADVDSEQLGLVGFSLGASTAMTFIARNPPGTVSALADYFGFLTPEIRTNVSRFPPTIIFHNKNDLIVPVKNSQDLEQILPKSISHQLVPPYDEHWEMVNHAFEPDGVADIDSRSRTTDWLKTHLPPIGKHA